MAKDVRHRCKYRIIKDYYGWNQARQSKALAYITGKEVLLAELISDYLYSYNRNFPVSNLIYKWLKIQFRSITKKSSLLRFSFL